MTPQELEALLQKAHAHNYDKYRDQRIEHFVGPTLCKLAPGLAALWRAAEEWNERGNTIGGHKACARLVAALALLREAKP